MFSPIYSFHVTVGVDSEVPLESYCAETQMQDSSATHLLNLVLHTEGFNFFTNAEADGHSHISNSHCSPYKWTLRSAAALGLLTLSYAVLLMLGSGCHMPVSVT